MFTQNSVKEILKRELPFLRKRFFVRRIALFGSFAKGTYTNSSDVDIAVEFERPIGLIFVELAEYLENVLGRKTDVLTIGGIKAIRIKSAASSIEEDLLYVQ
ncbi:MAG: nucleotidyltransferase family protein [Candidatus Margulisiibacteriota bacterium]